MGFETLDEKIKKYKKIYDSEIEHIYSDSDEGETELFKEKVEKYKRKTNRNDDDPR